jgi:hypothetical protein
MYGTENGLYELWSHGTVPLGREVLVLGGVWTRRSQGVGRLRLSEPASHAQNQLHQFPEAPGTG